MGPRQDAQFKQPELPIQAFNKQLILAHKCVFANRSLINAFEQFGDSEIECPGNGVDALEGQVSFSTFYLSDVCPMHPTCFGHLLL
jgi:hypothetical protein